MKCYTVFDGYGKRGGGISLGDAAKDGRKGKTKERDKEEKENRKEKKTWHSQGGSNPSSTRTKWHGSKSWIRSKQILAKYVVNDKGDRRSGKGKRKLQEGAESQKKRGVISKVAKVPMVIDKRSERPESFTFGQFSATFCIAATFDCRHSLQNIVKILRSRLGNGITP